LSGNSCCPAFEVPADYFLRDGKPVLVWAIGAFDARLFTDAADPFATGGGIAGFAGSVVFKTAGIDVRAATEEGAETSDFGGERRVAGECIHQPAPCYDTSSEKMM
jgi:hypothetical protein